MMNAREKLETEVAAGLFKANPEQGFSEQSRLDALYNQKLNNVVRGVDTYWLSNPFVLYSITNIVCIWMVVRRICVGELTFLIIVEKAL